MSFVEQPYAVELNISRYYHAFLQRLLAIRKVTYKWLVKQRVFFYIVFFERGAQECGIDLVIA